MERYTFSGHDSFTCKSLWLKKGYDYLHQERLFTSNDAVIHLGVGKNMVASMRYWLRAFGLVTDDTLSDIAHYIFNEQTGCDKYIEDLGTLWLLHYYLIKSKVASLYNLTFLQFKRERQEFDKDQLQAFVKRKCAESKHNNMYNENTVKKDINVFLNNYVMPVTGKSLESFMTLMLELGLVEKKENTFRFAETNPGRIPEKILLYCIIDYKGNDNTVPFEVLHDLALIFGLSNGAMVEKLKRIERAFPQSFRYTDNAGIKQVQFLEEIDKFNLLDTYYTNE